MMPPFVKSFYRAEVFKLSSYVFPFIRSESSISFVKTGMNVNFSEIKFNGRSSFQLMEDYMSILVSWNLLVIKSYKWILGNISKNKWCRIFIQNSSTWRFHFDSKSLHILIAIRDLLSTWRVNNASTIIVDNS